VRRALSAALPRFRWRAADPQPLVPLPAREAAPALAEEFEVLDRELLPTFHELDQTALRAQNTFRRGQLFVIVGGLAAASLGAAQAAVGGGVLAIGIAEALCAGTLAAVTTYARGRRPQEEYLTARLKAERLRGEYFLFLGRVDPYDASGKDARVQTLRRRVAAIEAEEPA
jgi:Protein of unknown function (DUF4231)